MANFVKLSNGIVVNRDLITYALVESEHCPTPFAAFHFAVFDSQYGQIDRIAVAHKSVADAKREIASVCGVYFGLTGQEQTNGEANSQSEIVGESGPGLAADIVGGTGIGRAADSRSGDESGY